MTEQWRPVVGWEGVYEVSNQGQVRSIERVVEQSNGSRRKFPGVIRKETYDSDGYPMVNLSHGGVRRSCKIHNLVAEAFIGPRPDGMHVCHGPRGKTDNSVANLRYDTPSENSRDVARHGNHRDANKTHCPRNHPLTLPNLVPAQLRSGHRKCLACDRAQSAIWNAKQAGRPIPDFRMSADVHYERIMAAATERVLT